MVGSSLPRSLRLKNDSRLMLFDTEPVTDPAGCNEMLWSQQS
jgi:hypothetical protein